MAPYLAFGSMAQARVFAAAYESTSVEMARQLSREIETERLTKVFVGLDLVVLDELSRTGCTRSGRPLRGRRTAP